MHYDAVIVGGGPIGGYIAGSISARGFSVLVAEEHPRPGLPVQCAGLVTPKLEELVDLKKSVLNTVNGAHIHSPSGHKLVLDTGKPKAHVIDRAKLDQQILYDAESSGSELRMGTRVIDAKRIGDGSRQEVELVLKSKAGQETVKTPLVIGADGASSKIRALFGFPEPKMILKGMGMEFEYTDIPQDFVQIYSGNQLAPGFFAWVIPTGERVRIGLCVLEPKDKLQDFFNSFRSLCLQKKLIPDAKPVTSITGTIPLGVLSKTTADNIMLVGDAAAQVKPTSGGGVYPGLRCAKVCSETAVSALEAENFSNDTLVQYHKNWYKEIGSELTKGYRLHKAFLQLSDEKIEEAFNILDKPDVLEVISKKGDIESPFKLAKLLFKKAPKLIKFAGPYFRSAFN
ncbi:MAG: NAD(P)/FAD-dependent oxidoreductase [Thermoplasmata archaeon]|nr:MAG: NAD(P)/FAD-dependent oxidoreductase [Thermoplasmata archaeon]